VHGLEADSAATKANRKKLSQIPLSIIDRPYSGSFRDAEYSRCGTEFLLDVIDPFIASFVSRSILPGQYAGK
jgi:hypothetical protein